MLGLLMTFPFWFFHQPLYEYGNNQPDTWFHFLMEEASGSISSVNSNLILTSQDSPTYEVPINDPDYGIGPGISYTSSARHESADVLTLQGSKSLTIEVWVSGINLLDGTSYYVVLGDANDFTSDYIIAGYSSALASLQLFVYDRSKLPAVNINAAVSGLNINDGNPHHLRFVIDKAIASGSLIAVDGVTRATGDCTKFNEAFVLKDISIGNYHRSPTVPANGTIYEVRASLNTTANSYP